MGEDLEKVSSFKCMGSMVTEDGNMEIGNGLVLFGKIGGCAVECCVIEKYC